MTRDRALHLAEKWSNGEVCTLRSGEAEEYHEMFLDMLSNVGEWILDDYQCGGAVLRVRVQ